MRHKILQIIVLISFLIMTTATIPLGYAYEWSPDMGLTWNSESDLNPSIAQASDGKIWLVWNSYRTGNPDLFYKVYDSSKVHPWSSETRLTTNTQDDMTPAIMQAQDGKLWVVWSTNRDGNYEIYYKTSSNNGATWSTENRLTTNPKKDECPSIMQAANGTIWLAWSANRTKNYGIYYRISQDNGATWSTDKWHNLTGTDYRDPSITQAADGTIWFVWVQNVSANYDIVYKTYFYDYIWNRWRWSGTTYVTDPPESDIFDLNPSVMAAKDGKIWVVWDSDRNPPVGEQVDIYYKVREGSTWSYKPIMLTCYTQDDDIMPSIMQAADGTIWIVWASFRPDNNYDIYYKTTKIQLNVDGFSEASDWTGWTRVGSSPWLGAADYPYNYINTSVTNAKIGNFTFQDLPTGIVWNTVKLHLKTWQSGGDGNDYINISLYDGSTWITTPYTVTPTSTTAPGNYKEVDVSSWLNAEAKINATKMRLEKITSGTPDTIGVDHAFISLPSHDVAIFSVNLTQVTVNQGQKVFIEVVAQNHGDYYENFKVRLYADSTLVNESNTIGLSLGQLSGPITLTWTASNAGTYKIWANTSVVNGEIYILDNFFPAILGDVNGDRTVNTSDLSALSNAYGSKPGDANWNPNCNFYGDNKVDAYDLFDLGKNFGSSQ